MAGRLRRVRALLHAGRAALPGARRARRGPDRAARQRALPVPGRSATSRASSSSPTTSRRPGCTRSTRRAACMLDEADTPQQPLRALRDVRRLPVPGAREVRRRGAGGAAGADASATSRCSPARGRCGWRPTRPARRSPAWSSSATASRRRSPPTSSSSSCGAANSAALLLSSANAAHPHGLANASGQVGRNYMFHNSQAVLALSQGREPDGLPEDARAQRLLLRRRTDFEFPLGNIQMVGKSSADMYRGEKPLQTKLAPQWTLREGRPPRGRLLALHRGPAAAGEPGHAAPRRQHRSSPTSRPTRSPRSGCSPSSSSCSSTSGCTSTT